MVAAKIVPYFDERVYDHETFLAEFDKDLAKATSCVFLQSAFLSEPGFERTIDRVKELTARGVRICIFLRPPRGWRFRKRPPGNETQKRERAECAYFEQAVEAFRAAGAHVNLWNQIHEKVSIIDGVIFWDGSLNILSFEVGHSRERMTRHLDPYLLADAIQRHHLNECEECMKQQEETPAPVHLAVDAESFGATMRMRRKLLKLSQDDLAARLGMNRGTLSAIESGEQVPRLDTAIKIANILDCSLAWVPSSGLNVLRQIVTAMPAPRGTTKVKKSPQKEKNRQE